MLNRCIVAGRMVKDPELRTTQSGISVASFTLAVERDIKSKNGEKETDFIDVVAWRHTAEYVCKYISKGSMVVVSGRLQIRSWKDRDGNNRRNSDIQAEQIYSFWNTANNHRNKEPQNDTQQKQEYFEEIPDFDYELPDEFNSDPQF